MEPQDKASFSDWGWQHSPSYKTQAALTNTIINCSSSTCRHFNQV